MEHKGKPRAPASRAPVVNISAVMKQQKSSNSFKVQRTEKSSKEFNDIICSSEGQIDTPSL